MVRKFVLLKTNKEEEAEEYPAYALHYTDFSPNRKEPLSRNAWVSESREQMGQLFEQCKADYIKKRWSPFVDSEADDSSVDVDEEARSKPRRATKSQVAKKNESDDVAVESVSASDAKPKRTTKKLAAKKRKAK